MANEIQKIRKAIALNQVVIFIGNNVSIYTNNSEEEVVHWKGLLKDGLRHCQHLNDKFESNTAEVNADHIKTCLSQKNLYRSWLREKQGEIIVRKPELIQAIGELGCPILTTNYDLLLEDILKKKSLTWNKYYANYTDESIENLKDFILHLHGYFSEPDSIIFTPSDYDRLHSNRFARSKLKQLLNTKTLLFIGYDRDTSDPNFSNLLKWIFHKRNDKSLSIYQLVKFDKNGTFLPTCNIPFHHNIQEVIYGNTFEDLLVFIKHFKSFTFILRENSIFTNKKSLILKKYLNYIIDEYGHISIFGYSNTNLTLPLENVYVELKFDPAHPSIKAMKTLEITEEFKRKLLSPGFFTDQESKQINQAIYEKNPFNLETIYRDLMIDQWLDVLLSNRTIFTQYQAYSIKRKIIRLKNDILEKSQFKEVKQYQIQQAYNQFKHFVILGHPGSGKTTISKWLAINMAKQCLNETNRLYDCTEKLPILIPIWKYVDQIKQSQQKKSLLQFIYENPTLNSTYFTPSEQIDLSALILYSLIQGNVLLIFEGLDEVPAHIDRSDLMKEINALLERGIDYDVYTDKLSYSIHEQKEIYGTKFPNLGNRVIITSRIEGNYFEEIHFSIPRLTIDNMSNDALKLFCRSYMECINQTLNKKTTCQTDQLYEEIIQNKDILQLAINPQIASVIAAIYNQLEDKLPEKRIDLYEIAIEKMIERLVHLSIDDLGLTATMFWSILQEIADFLHSKVEGLSENMLKEIINKCLKDFQIDDSTSKLVDIFKYQAGVLNEFGYDSYRFIHRTFQEYLAAKSIIYFNGIQRSDEIIVENIKNKIGIPNWRVPLSMTFGILSKLPKENELFNHILTQLLTNEQTSVNTQLVPFIIIDSLNDMYFFSNDIESELIEKLANMLLLDYINISGFSKLKDHQELIHTYFSKLQRRSNHTLSLWLIRKINFEEYIAPCANIIYKLKWYNSKFHEIFLKNLHNDSVIWNWPIDTLLRFYSDEITDDSVLAQLPFKKALIENPHIVEQITQNKDWLRLITSLYGGYQNANTPSSIAEYREIAQFLDLSEMQRQPFTFYYQEVWDRNDPAYSMAVYLDKKISKEQWIEKPIFDINKIYKESFLTIRILELLNERQLTEKLEEELRLKLNDDNLNINEKTEAYITLIVLGDFDLISTIKHEREIISRSVENRIEQLIFVLKDPIARYSSHLANYLIAIYNETKESNWNFTNYCRIYLSLIAISGGLPMDTKILAETMDDMENKCDLYAEYFAWNLTGAHNFLLDTINNFLEQCIQSCKSDEIVKSFLKISESIQFYKPIRAYPWPIDKFTFQTNDEDDIPIGFFNSLENLNRNLVFVTKAIWNVFIKEGYFEKNPELIPLVILFQYGSQSKRSDIMEIYGKLLPELVEETNVKEFLLKKIQSMSNPYYKSRALYQLAEFYDEKYQELLMESFAITKNLSKAVLKFQVLEKIFYIIHCKNIEEKLFIQQILDELILTYNSIEEPYNRVIASIKLSFYGSGEFRQKHLRNALKILLIMNEDNEKMKLIMKLKPFIGIYSHLDMKLNNIIENLKSQTSRYFVNSLYGRILFTENHQNLSDYTELQALFLLFAQLNDVKLLIGQNENIDQLWINLFHDIDSQSNMEKLLKVGLTSELFLTPVATIVIDELIQQGKEKTLSILFPYIIKPSNEVLPTVQRWFTGDQNKQIQQFAALLLADARHVFERAIDPLLDLLTSDNDQMRYRAQQIFQHPDRNPQEPNKRISIFGEKTLIKILQSLSTMNYLPRVQAYLVSFFYDLHWDDPQVFENLIQSITKFNIDERKIFLTRRIHFTNVHTWNSILRTVESSIDPLYVEEFFQSIMTLVLHNQLTEDHWIDFVRILSRTNLTQFRDKLYFTGQDVDIIDFIIDKIFAVTYLTDETYFAILESKLISEITIQIEDLAQNNYDQIQDIARCNFNVSRNYNQTVLNMLNNLSLTIIVMENLIQWLIQKMMNFKDFDNTMFSCIMLDCLLALISACVQKDDYLYRKITNASTFNKLRMIKLLEKILNHHPYFPARGNAFIILVAMDHSDHQVIVNAMNTLLDENLVKEYLIIGIPLIHLSPNEFIDDLLDSLRGESAIKTYEILKIFTDFALNEKIDANNKSKIINYLANEIGQLESKKLVNYYYTDIKIPFTTTLENELYKAWIKIQGLSGKTQYSIDNKDLK